MNMNKKQLKEGLADMAYKAESDHEVQMARAELYKIAKYSIKLHEMLKGVDESAGLEGWVQSKITKSADYLGSVYHHLDYQMKFDEVAEAVNESEKDTHCSDKCCGADVKREDCTCAPTCKHCNCNDNSIPEGKSPHKKGTKKYKKHMAAMHAEGDYKEHIRNRLKEALAELEETANTCPECGNLKATDEQFDEAKQRLDPKCWKGKKIGNPKTKMKGGVRVNNCVPA